MFHSDAEVEQLRVITTAFGTAYQRLRGIAMGKGDFSWQLKPKVHKFMHMPFLASVMNVRCASCYADESAVGTTCGVWKRSVAGRYKRHVQRNVLTKRWLAVLLRFELEGDA